MGRSRHKEVPAAAGTSVEKLRLEFHDVLSLISLRPFGHIELYVVAFVQRFKASGLNSGMVHENIIPGIAPDESVALFIVKPLNYALFFHFSSYLHRKKPAGHAGYILTVCFRSI